jgi:hypothetical protein
MWLAGWRGIFFSSSSSCFKTVRDHSFGVIRCTDKAWLSNLDGLVNLLLACMQFTVTVVTSVYENCVIHRSFLVSVKVDSLLIIKEANLWYHCTALLMSKAHHFLLFATLICWQSQTSRKEAGPSQNYCRGSCTGQLYYKEHVQQATIGVNTYIQFSSMVKKIK